jgi:hypothetical protein
MIQGSNLICGISVANCKELQGGNQIVLAKTRMIEDPGGCVLYKTFFYYPRTVLDQSSSFDQNHSVPMLECKFSAPPISIADTCISA